MIDVLSAVVSVVIAAGTIYCYKKYKERGYDINVEKPEHLRTDLLYGYYGCETDQVNAVKDHTNLHWESQFNGVIRASADIIKSGKYTVLDVMPQLFQKIAESGRNYDIHPDAESNLIKFFDYLQLDGSLIYVKALVPIDEPNINCVGVVELHHACSLIQKVSAFYPELKEVKLACIYAAKPTPFDCIERFDLVGVNDYDKKSSILNGSYQELLKEKRPDAGTILLPGGAFGQNPEPFINWAHKDSNVKIVLPFCWFGPREPRDKWTGIGYGNLKDTYINVGKALVNKGGL